MTPLFEPFFQCFYFPNDPTFVTLRQYFSKFVILYQPLPTFITLPSTFVIQLQYILFLSFVIIDNYLPIIFLSSKYVTHTHFLWYIPSIILLWFSHYSFIFVQPPCLAHVYPHQLCILLFLHQLVKYTALCIFFSHICRYSPKHFP